jgi:asparagine synthase (glutamine-hydrolysing)
MCGIAGVFAYRDGAPPVDREELVRIREAMLARGPDGSGLWISTDERTGLAHRRLAIIDLSDCGAQPMATSDGRLRIVFNGEIYNYRELRKELEAKNYRFHSNSDTEVLLHLYADRGADMVQSLRGMYAFAIWDEREKGLFLARDPFGIKPLYYADDGCSVRFASQVKALLKGGAVDTAPEPAGSVGFLIWGSVPEPYTLYRGIRSLPAGAHMRVSRDAGPAIARYFDVGDEFRKAEQAPRAAASNAAEILRDALADSVRHHLVSDVPVGHFLSAGHDSSILAGLAVEQNGGAALNAVTLGFPEFQGTDHDEVPIARMVAEAFGIHHQAQWVKRTDFDNELSRILDCMDQPSTDGVNTYFVSRAAARAGMKVAFSGLGGDELFGGYPSFSQVPQVAARLGFTRGIPIAGRLARRVLAPFVSALTSPKYAGLLEYGGTYGGAYLLRRALFMPWEATSILDPATVAAGLEKLQILENLEATVRGLRQPRSRIAALELSWYMRNQLLRDADWAGMAHSLEIRVPLVDVQLLRALAPLMVSDRYPTKVDFARVLPAPLPAKVLSRAKTGFTTPVREWISAAGSGSSPSTRGLRGWAQRVLPPQPRMFRALVLVTDAFGGRGGIAKFNRDLLTALASMPECAEVVVVPRLISSPFERLPPRVTFVEGAAGGKIRFVRSACVEAFRGHIDFLISGHINLAPLSALLASVRRVPSLLIVYGIDAWTRRGPLASRSLSRFTMIAGVSNLTLARFGSWASVDASKLRLLPGCVDARTYGPGPKPSDLAERLGLTNRTVIMTLGRLATEERYKGFDEILEALPALARQVPDISYLICGDGADRGRLEAKAEALKVRDRVVFTGFVPEDQKADYYRLADAYVMPSRGEGFGIVLLEALACGIPALGSRLDGSREALLSGTLGYLADPSNPGDVEAGVLMTLKRGTGKVPEGLRHYSHEAFALRTEAIVREALGH